MDTKIVVGGLVLFFLLVGCSSKEEIVLEIEQEKKEQMQNRIKELPKWIISPKVEGKIATVGMTSYSKHGLHSMLTLAEMDARAKLAGQIQTTVSRLQEMSMRQIKIEKIDDLENIFSQVTREVIKDVPISGAKRVDIHQAKDGGLYVLMAIDNKNVKEILEQSRAIYKKHMENANVAKQNLDQGMIILDDMIDRLEEAKVN